MNEGLRLGELISIFSKYPKDSSVKFQFESVEPRPYKQDLVQAYFPSPKVMRDFVPNLEYFSYRGYYADVAIGFKPAEKKPLNVEVFLTFLKSLIGATWTGYKGGEYEGDKRTHVWIENNDEDMSDVMISEVREHKGVIIIQTECEED